MENVLEMTVREAKDLIRDNLVKGSKCPCCNQKVALNKSTLSYKHAKLLEAMSEHGNDWIHLATDLPRSVVPTNYATLKYWGLIMPKAKDENDDKPASGYWKLTMTGRLFVEGEMTAPKDVYFFNNTKIGQSKKEVTFNQAIKKRFSYSEIMAR